MNEIKKTVKAIELELKSASSEALLSLIKVYEVDTRQSVIKLCQKYKKQLETLEKLKEEWADKLYFDQAFRGEHKLLIGIDEVGRGPLAGPVVACAVVLPDECELLGVKDSKKIAEEKREALYDEIMHTALHVGIGIVDAPEIDEINILQATFKAMRIAIEELAIKPEVILVDGDKVIKGVGCTQHAVVKGDNKSAAIAAASIVAKVTRDRMMKAYAKDYPHYDWESNKGYGSNAHYNGIRAHGITPLHRKTFLKNEGF
ncbi:ribonuclease HII [Niameybacter massiliensis]|uniref:ribonuclease HII n=1 Tax=Niameybacter massiliensis TaxID=1658108 RepID=UPI0006B69E08|nr:ribonuclease HII [Niameybacter massiliensis]